MQTSAQPSEQLWFMNTLVTIAVSRSDNADGISVLEHRIPFGDAPPLHVHHEEDEIFVILDGQIKFEVGGAEIVARAGDTLCAARGVPHRYRVASLEGARCLTITRGGFEAMVRAVSRPALQPTLPVAMEPTPELLTRLADACAAASIELIGPPLAA